MQRAYAYGVTVIVLSWSASGYRSLDADDYPLSTYPMFARRGQVGDVTSALAIAADGRSSPVPPSRGHAERCRRSRRCGGRWRVGRASGARRAIAERVSARATSRCAAR
jgi:hypothetical protein